MYFVRFLVEISNVYKPCEDKINEICNLLKADLISTYEVPILGQKYLYGVFRYKE